jgi:phosphotriesterase-related protein
VQDLTSGIGDTGIRAAIIKIASDASITPFEQRVLIAATSASQATGAPILTHTAVVHRTGELQAAEFERLGLDPTRAAIGHSDDSADIGYLRGLLDRGYWLAFDRLPNGALAEYGGQGVDERLRMTVALVRLGYGDQLLLGHDDPIWAGLLSDDDQARHKAANPDSIAFISRVALPRLRELGLDDDAIRRLTVDNPRRWLTGESAAPTSH